MCLDKMKKKIYSLRGWEMVVEPFGYRDGGDKVFRVLHLCIIFYNFAFNKVNSQQHN